MHFELRVGIVFLSLGLVSYGAVECPIRILVLPIRVHICATRFLSSEEKPQTNNKKTCISSFGLGFQVLGLKVGIVFLSQGLVSYGAVECPIRILVLPIRVHICTTRFPSSEANIKTSLAGIYICLSWFGY